MPPNKTPPLELHLPPKYLQMVQAILRQHLPQSEVWAYGSRVNGDHYDASDLDLVVRHSEDLKRRHTHLAEVADAFCESNIPILVQIVDWASIPPEFHREILAGYVVVQEGSAG